MIYLVHWDVFKILLFTGCNDCTCTPKHRRRYTELFKGTIGESCGRERDLCRNIYFIKLLCLRSEWIFFVLIIRYFLLLYFYCNYFYYCKENENITWRKAAEISVISIIIRTKITIFRSHFNPNSFSWCFMF